MRPERRRDQRVTFQGGVDARLMAIDGTWWRDCIIEDISEAGAKLSADDGALEGLHLKEFFLVLSSMGLAFRRCELEWVNGSQFGVTFLKQSAVKKKSPQRNPA